MTIEDACKTSLRKRANAVHVVELLIVAVVVLVLLLLAGCATTEDTVVRRVEVPVACVEEIPPRPVMLSDSQLKRLASAAYVRALAAQRFLIRAWAGELEAALIACKAPPQR